MKSQWRDHPRQLDHLAQLHLPPLTARVGLAQGGDQRACLGPQPLLGLGQRPQLVLEPPPRLVALAVQRQQLLIDPPELVAQRPDQLLDRLCALVQVAPRLGLAGRQLRPGELGQRGPCSPAEPRR